MGIARSVSSLGVLCLCACGATDPGHAADLDAGCLYDSPLGAFVASFASGERCLQTKYAVGTGTVPPNGCATHTLDHPLSCDRPTSHGAGWVNLLDGGTHHVEALASVAACARCHEGLQATCVACHGAVSGRSPHRPGWIAASWDWTTVTNPACFACHR